MDILEDQWWPTTVTSSHPFSLPPSSNWLLKQESGFITLVSGGNQAVYHVHPGCLPFLMLLDMVQQMYLSMANLADPSQSITFYKGVMFLDSLRQDVMAGLRNNNDMDRTTLKMFLSEGMQRWLCRLLLSLPHDPQNRKRNATVLQNAYKEIDVFKYGMPFI